MNKIILVVVLTIILIVTTKLLDSMMGIFIVCLAGCLILTPTEKMDSIKQIFKRKA